MSRRARIDPSRWVAAILLVFVATLAHHQRRRAIASIFSDRPARLLSEPARAGSQPSPRQVGVILLDGLSRSTTDKLASWQSLCAGATAVVVDSGFPTVSLPVQHVLWTGRTQQESGVYYRQRVLSQPPEDALPQLVDRSIAIAQGHGEIVNSFGFGSVELHEVASDSSEFFEHATRLLEPAPDLFFAHVLAIDAAGHRAGRESAAYLRESELGVEFARRLVARDSQRDWIVLSDHGHLARGGHGDAETEIRNINACFFGDWANIASLSATDRIMPLTQVSHALFAALGATPSRVAPLAKPDPPLHAWLVGLLLAVAAAWQLHRARALAAGIVAGGLCVAAYYLKWGFFSLSHTPTFPTWSWQYLPAAAPGLALVVWVGWRKMATDTWRLVAAASLGWLAVCVAGDPASSFAGHAVKLVPWATATYLAALWHVSAGCVALAFSCLVVRSQLHE